MTVSTLGQQERDRSSRTVAEWLWPLLPIAVSVFTLSALLYYHLRRHSLQVTSPLQVGVAWVYRSFGFAPAFVGFMLLLTWGSIWFVSGRVERPLARLARIGLMVVMLGVFLNLGNGGVAYEVHKGELGAWFGGVLVSTVGYYPGLVLVWAVTVAALLLATDFFFRDAFERLRAERPDEVGVETEVTDHLRGLAAIDASTQRSAPVAPPSLPAATAPVPELALDLAAEGGEAPEVEPEVGIPAAPAAGWRARRASYFDRRRGDAGAEAAADAAWPPTAPESQDIENAEAVEHVLPVVGEAASRQAFGRDEAVDEVVDVEADDVVVIDALDGADLAGAEPAVPDRAVGAAVVAAQPDGGGHAERGRVAMHGAQVAEPSEPADVQEPDDEDAVGTAGDEDFPGALGAGEDGAVEAGDRGAGARGAFDLDAAADEAGPSEADRGFAVEVPRQPAHVDATDESAEIAAEITAEELAQAAEPLVAIPRPTVTPAPARQQGLFGDGLDAELIEDAAEIVQQARRVTAALLQRKLRIDFDLARRVLAELAARGVVELDEDEATGRVRG